MATLPRACENAFALHDPRGEAVPIVAKPGGGGTEGGIGPAPVFDLGLTFGMADDDVYVLSKFECIGEGCRYTDVGWRLSGS